MLRKAGVFVALVLMLATVGVAQPAGAQQTCGPQDPYSGGQPCNTAPTCSLTKAVTENGVHSVHGDGFGTNDEVVGVYDGTEVFRIQTTNGSFDASFTVPSRPPGEYALVVTGSPSGQECDPPFKFAAAGTAVLGQQFTRGDATSTSRGGTSTSGGVRGFARTGAEIGLLVLLGVALVLVGRRLRRASAHR